MKSMQRIQVNYRSFEAENNPNVWHLAQAKSGPPELWFGGSFGTVLRDLSARQTRAPSGRQMERV